MGTVGAVAEYMEVIMPHPEAKRALDEWNGATCTTSAGEQFNVDLMFTAEDNARMIADDIAYKRQREWSGFFTIDRYKLREIIAEAILKAIEDDRERRDK